MCESPQGHVDKASASTRAQHEHGHKYGSSTQPTHAFLENFVINKNPLCGMIKMLFCVCMPVYTVETPA